ncbi:MAG: hypothetical protein JSS32_07555 [Verrucomicrobia bacterium]|nr:hypothetical protein [Verrucomicrobiota bacterium]
MNSFPITSEDHFRAVKAWFKNSDAAPFFENIEEIKVENTFPNVVNIVCGGRSRFFTVSTELANKVANSIFVQIPVTPDEGAFLEEVRTQLDGRIQYICDVPGMAIDKTKMIAASQPRFIRSFEVPSRMIGYKRLAIDVRVDPDLRRAGGWVGTGLNVANCA